MEEIRALYIITEGQMDAAIIHTVLDCSKFDKVYHIPAGGYGNLSSVAKTVRLMSDPQKSSDRIIISFDADNFIPSERVNTMRFLTNADYDKRIGVFCFAPDIEHHLFPELKIDKKGSNMKEMIVAYMKENIGAIKDVEVIKEMQSFIDN